MYMYKIEICSITLLDKCLLFYLIFLSFVSNKCSLVCLIKTKILGGSKGLAEERRKEPSNGGRGCSQRRAKGSLRTFSPVHAAGCCWSSANLSTLPYGLNFRLDSAICAIAQRVI
jgi:hypothetical protein